MDQKSIDEMTIPMKNSEEMIEDESEIQQLNDELEKLENEEKWLDQMIENVQDQLDVMA